MISDNMRGVRFSVRLQLTAVFVFLLIGFLAAGPAFAEVDLTQMVKKLRPTVVVIITYDADGNARTQGSGFFMSSEGEIVTNYHVLDGAYSASVKTSSGETFAIKGLVAEDKKNDLAKITLDLKGKKSISGARAAPLADSLPAAGQRIFIIGNPLGFEASISDGIVSAVREMSDLSTALQVTAPFSHGSSGSPVFSLSGEVVGVATAINTKGQNINFAVPVSAVKALENHPVISLEALAKKATDQWLNTAEGLYQLGDYCLVAGEYELALEAYKRSIRLDPTSVDAHVSLGNTYLLLHRYPEAIGPLNQAVRLRPNDPFQHFSVATVYNIVGEYQKAEKEFKEAIRLKPDYGDAYGGLALSYQSLKKYPEAIEMYKRALNLEPECATYYAGFAGLLLQLGHHSEAIEVCKAAIRLDADSVSAHRFLGIAYFLTGNKAGALEEYKILKEMDTEAADDLFDLIYE